MKMLDQHPERFCDLDQLRVRVGMGDAMKDSRELF